MKRRLIDADKLIADFEARRDFIARDEINFDGEVGENMRAGAILALNQALEIIKELAHKPR